MSELSLGQIIEQKREAAFLTRKELCNKVGVSGEAIRLIEKGQRNPSRHTLKRLAAILDFSIDGFSVSKLSRGRGHNEVDMSDIISLMDDVLLDLSETKGPKLDEKKLRKLPPWRAYMIAIVANRCGAFPDERLEILRRECMEKGGDRKLSEEVE